MARISELHYSNAWAAATGTNEFLEVALALDEDPADFVVSFYNSDGSLILEVPLTDPNVQVAFDPQSNENTYVIQQGPFDIFLTDPDGGGVTNAEAYALTNTDTGTVIDFYDIGGGTQNIVAIGGVADGATSQNIPVTTPPNDADYSIQFNQPNPDTPVLTSISQSTSGVVCFAAGTMIRTPDGETPVEVLRPGDRVDTLDHGAQRLLWVGSVTVPALGNMAPVVLSARALGTDRDLVVSPCHRVLVRGALAEAYFGEPEVLAPAAALINGDTIYRRSGGLVQYHHLLFRSHQLVWSNGALSESLHPGARALAAIHPKGRSEILSLFPELATVPESYGPTVRPLLRRAEAPLAIRLLQ